MKYIIHFYLLILVILPTASHAQINVKSPFKTQISKYNTVAATVATVKNGENAIVFMESMPAKLGYYSITELGMIDKKAKPAMLKNLKIITEAGPVLVYNGKQIALPQPIRDCRILLPTSLSSFNLGSDKYLLLELDLISFSGNNGCEYLLLKLDTHQNITSISSFQTVQPLTQADLGDFDGDGMLDFQVNETDKVPYAVYRTTDSKKLKD